MTDLPARLRHLSTYQKRIESRELLMAAAERIAALERRQIPPSWASPDGTEWSAFSGDGILDVRGSKKDIEVVESWRHTKDRLAWFEEHYPKVQARVTELQRADEANRLELDLALHHDEANTPEEPVPSWDALLDAAVDSRQRGDRSAVQDSLDPETVFVQTSVGVTKYVTRDKFDRLLTAFHDATRRPLGVTPGSGLEFYDARMADEAEARRTRHGRGPK